MVFNFGHSKICRVTKHFQETGTIPEPINHSPTKLANPVLTSIHNSIMSDAYVTLKQIQENILTELQIPIALSTIDVGCKKLRYNYKPPQHTHLLSQIQKDNRLAFSNSVLTHAMKKKLISQRSYLATSHDLYLETTSGGSGGDTEKETQRLSSHKLNSLHL